MEADHLEVEGKFLPRPARVLYVSPFGCLYGGELCLFEVVTKSNQKLFAPQVVSGEYGPLVEALRSAGVGVEVMHLPYMTHRGWQAVRFSLMALPVSIRLARMIRKGKFDLVYNNSLLNPYGALAARLAGVPCIWHVHDLGKNPYLRFGITRLAELLADRIIVVSEAVKAIFSERGRKRIRVVYNGVDPQYFDPELVDEEIARQEYSISAERRPVIAMVARLHETKRPQDMILALCEIRQRWPDCLLLLAGEGPLEGELRSMVTAYNLEQNVHFLGYVSDVRKILKLANVVVLTSDHEAFPRVPLEAMAMCRAVVATEVGGIPEAVTPETGRLIPPGNISELVEAISYVLEDEQRADQLGQAGRERVLKHFSQQLYIQGVEQVMMEALAVHPIQHPQQTDSQLAAGATKS